MREAPSVDLIEALLGAGARVTAYDPEARESARAIFGDRVTLAVRSYDAVKDSDALAIVTEWNEFREPNFGRVLELMRSPVVFDGRNLYETEHMESLGFSYYSIGR